MFIYIIKDKHVTVKRIEPSKQIISFIKIINMCHTSFHLQDLYLLLKRVTKVVACILATNGN